VRGQIASIYKRRLAVCGMRHNRRNYLPITRSGRRGQVMLMEVCRT